MKKHQINIPVFNHKVTLVSCEINTILTYLNCLYNETIPSLGMGWDKAGAICFVLKGDIYIWWNTLPCISQLGHEVIHAVYEIISSRGIQITDQETFCYLWEYIMKEILCILSEQMEAINLQ